MRDRWLQCVEAITQRRQCVPAEGTMTASSSAESTVAAPSGSWLCSIARRIASVVVAPMNNLAHNARMPHQSLGLNKLGRLFRLRLHARSLL